MATTAVRPITLRRGDAYAHKIVLPSVDADLNPIVWTAATFRAQIRRTPNGPLLAEFAIDTSHKGDSPPYVVLTLEAATVGAVIGTDLLPERASWDFEETRNGKPFTPCGGTVTVELDVSHA